MEDITFSDGPSPCNEVTGAVHAKGGTEPGNEIRRVIKGSDGLLDPTPRGPYIAVTQRNQKESPFLRLPGELRNKIYAYIGRDMLALVRYRPTRSSPGKASIRFASHHLLHLLVVCRTIYSDTRLLPFTHGVFAFDYCISCYARSPYPLMSYLTQLLPIQINAITTTHLPWLCNDLRRLPIFDEARALPGLKRILIDGQALEQGVLYRTFGSVESYREVFERLSKWHELTFNAVRQAVGDSVRTKFSAGRGSPVGLQIQRMEELKRLAGWYDSWYAWYGTWSGFGNC